jgi:hypothetical protein
LEKAVDITKVSCNGCGASLEITSAARFVTCRYCGASLEIKRTDSAVFTEVLDRIDQRTSDIAQDVSALRRHQELEDLDRQWELRRQSLLVHGKYGDYQPSASRGTFTILAGVIGGLIWMTLTAAGRGAGAWPLLGLLFIGAGIGGGIRMLSKATQFEQERQHYQRRRDQIVQSDNRPPSFS